MGWASSSWQRWIGAGSVFMRPSGAPSRRVLGSRQLSQLKGTSKQDR